MIGIIGAMDVERAALRAMLSEPLEETVSGVTYTRGMLCGKQVVLAVCGIGKCNAAICAQTMILRYAPSLVINIGVAGTLTGELGIGDIVLGTSAVCHDMDTSPIGDPIGMISGINLIYIPLDEQVSAKMAALCEKEGIGVRRGIIASGDQFIDTKAKKDWIVETFHAIACEMEGQAVAQVCYVNATPCAILRSISDSADGTSMDYMKFKSLAAAHSTKVLCAFLSEN